MSVTEQDILDCRPMVRYTAYKFIQKVGYTGMDVADLVQVGYTGLVEASKRFQPGGSATFKTFARTRVHGAILDHLRSLDTVSRDARKAIKAGLAEPVYDVSLEATLADKPGLEPYHKPTAETDLIAHDLLKLAKPRETYVLRRKFLDDASQREIARELGCSPALVTLLMITGCKRIRLGCVGRYH